MKIIQVGKMKYLKPEITNSMEKIQLINIEWNSYNGFIFEILAINDWALFGINSAYKTFFNIHLCFIMIPIYNKTT